MKKWMKTIVLGLLILLLGIQFIPRDKSNRSAANTPVSIEKIHRLSDTVSAMLKTSCYDCHSNHTEYPWYSNIQPVNLWLAHHIEDGKKELNFSEFGNYSIRRQYFKLKEIEEQVEEGEMPLQSYTIIHKHAKLNAEQKSILLNWSHTLIDSFESVYPADTFKRNRRK